jgi:hypothetical protein
MPRVEKKRLLKDVTITHVSYVKRGANKKQFFFAKSICNKAEIEFPVKFFAKQEEDSEKKLLYGVVYEPDSEDTYGDIMTRDEIEKTAHEFLQYYRNIDTEHNLLAGAGVVVESYVAPISLSIGGSEIKAGSWVLVTKASDEIWEAWKDGDITGYSMFGISRETQMSKGETTMKSWVKKMLETLGLAKSFDDMMADTIEKMSSNPFFIMDIMQEDFFSNISWDSANEEQLTALSASMKSAADYIDKKISSIAKSDPTPTQEPKPEEPKPAENTPPAEPEKPETVPEETPKSEEPAPPADTEPEKPEPEKPEGDEGEPVAEVVKSMGTQFLQALNDMEKRFDGKIAELNKSLSETNEKLNEKRTNSAVSVPASVPVVRSKPRGSGLV